jgi:hypothetical protein
VVESVGVDLDWPRWEGSATLDRSGVAVLVVADGLDLAEQWLSYSVADFARQHDLVVVCGAEGTHSGPLGSYALTAQLREMLPRRAVIAVLVSDHSDAARQEFATIANLIDSSAVAVAVVLAEDVVAVAVLLARHLETLALLRLDRDGYQPISSDAGPA